MVFYGIDVDPVPTHWRKVKDVKWGGRIVKREIGSRAPIKTYLSLLASPLNLNPLPKEEKWKVFRDAL